ncbi:MAG: hypothetical protein VW779_02940 [Halieaceae bacterium]|jgi:hypothetical protein
MTGGDRIILSVAWANFLLGLAGILKFIPLGLVAVQSTLGANSTIAWRWSLDLISDTHWIFMVWIVVLAGIHFKSGRLLILPWRCGSKKT